VLSQPAESRRGPGAGIEPGLVVSSDAAENPGPGRLGFHDTRFVAEHFLPAPDPFFARDRLPSEGEKNVVMPDLGAVEPAVKPGELAVAAFPGEDLKAFAGAGLDQGGDEQTIENLPGAFAGAYQGSQFVGVGAFMKPLKSFPPGVPEGG